MGHRSTRAAPRFSILGDSRDGVFGHVFMFGVFRQFQRQQSDTAARSAAVVCDALDGLFISGLSVPTRELAVQ